MNSIGNFANDLLPMPFGSLTAREFLAASIASKNFLNDGTTKYGTAAVVMLAAASETSIKVVDGHKLEG